jgi:hypothetical protein
METDGNDTTVTNSTGVKPSDFATAVLKEIQALNEFTNISTAGYYFKVHFG